MMYSIMQRVYNSTVRDRLPQKLAVLNGVVARQPRLFDATDRVPEYEEACITALEKHITDGDDVVIVGGGFGVSAVKAARSAADVDVTVFEAAAGQVEMLEETLELNGGPGRVDVRHAVVSEAVDVWGEIGNADTVPPAELPSADVMEIDAEGAEISILEGLEIHPRVLVVESHGNLGAPTKAVRAQMEEIGYEITCVEPEAPERDVMVLTGVENGGSRTAGLKDE